MSLIEFHPDFGKLLIELRRIADALEVVVREEYHYNLRPPKADVSGVEPDVTYASDEGTLRQEVEDAVKGLPPELLEDEPVTKE